MQITKTVVDNLRFIALDLIGDCTKDDCPAKKACHYKKVGMCKYRKTYIMHVINSYVEEVKNPDRLTLLEIGSLLIPLWDQLVRLKLEELGQKKFMGKGGKTRSIFMNIRDVIKTINKIEGDLGIRKNGRKSSNEPASSERDNLMYGDPDYYESLRESAPTGESETEDEEIDESVYEDI